MKIKLLIIFVILAMGYAVSTLIFYPSYMGNENEVSFSFATTDAEKAKGLGGVENLPAKTALVFPYDQERQLCFWMKDMKFSIDMIWLDTNKKIVAIEENVAPDTYPQTFCHTGQYVIEVNAYHAKALGWQTNQLISF